MSQTNNPAAISAKLSITKAPNEPSTLEIAEDLLGYLKAVDGLQLPPLGNNEDIRRELNNMPLENRMLLADSLKKMRIEDKLQIQLRNIDKQAMEAAKTLQVSREENGDDGAARELSEKTLLRDFEIALGGLEEASCMRYAKKFVEVAQFLDSLTK